MIISIWADIACPFSYVGITRLKKALSELGIAEETPLDFKAFQLDPTLPTTTEQSMTEYYAQTHQLSLVDANKKLAEIDQFAASAGLDIQMENAIPVNTLTAHRLIKYVKTLGDQDLVNQLVDRLYKLYFTSNKSVADPAVLTATLAEFDLDQEAVKDVITSDKYEDEVRKDERRAFMIGMPSAPLFVINNKYSITGAQPDEVFVASLKKIMKMK
ncbi:DsbA family oxidoreductase [Limosilactobacillus caccae]|uniref:DsbA family oxidoreductase n=1 Tax=Limosilactobacillus caccae TaxID=1926284 RepID=UPI00097080EF|nr:DsbA family oxidoreductase [Limosilactobacillus caccae]